MRRERLALDDLVEKARLSERAAGQPMPEALTLAGATSDAVPRPAW